MNVEVEPTTHLCDCRHKCKDHMKRTREFSSRALSHTLVGISICDGLFSVYFAAEDNEEEKSVFAQNPQHT